MRKRENYEGGSPKHALHLYFHGLFVESVVNGDVNVSLAEFQLKRLL